MTDSPRRILLKLSGEALMGSQSFGIDEVIYQCSACGALLEVQYDFKPADANRWPWERTVRFRTWMS